MSQWSENKLSVMEDLSALMDGELDVSTALRACDQWRDDHDTRAIWHAYHLIGDVLRSDDLVSDASHDAAFLAAFRQRLAQEPVVLAPSAALPTPLASRRSWATPMVVAAGFVVVAGVLVVTQMSGGLSLRGVQSGGDLAQAPSALSGVVMVSGDSASGVALDPPVMVLNGQLVRDVRLDEYLAAHKKFGGSSAPGGPSGFLRNAAADGSTH